MSDVVLGTIIGGLIGILSTIISSLFVYFNNKNLIEENNKNEYRKKKIEAYEILLEKINDGTIQKLNDFDFYYSKVLPYISDVLRRVVDEYYRVHFVNKGSLFEKEKSIGKVNEVARAEMQIYFNTKNKRKRKLDKLNKLV